MRPLPPGWPRISSALFYADAAAAIPWLERAFGFETRIKVEGENGAILHSELVFGEGVVIVAAEDRSRRHAAPSALDGLNTQCLFAYVDDVEAHCERARAAGAKIIVEPTTTDYGEEYWSDRGYEAEDLGGHRWWFAQRMRTGG